jgi:hypothetical protein
MSGVISDVMSIQQAAHLGWRTGAAPFRRSVPRRGRIGPADSHNPGE